MTAAGDECSGSKSRPRGRMTRLRLLLVPRICAALEGSRRVLLQLMTRKLGVYSKKGHRWCARFVGRKEESVEWVENGR